MAYNLPLCLCIDPKHFKNAIVHACILCSSICTRSLGVATHTTLPQYMCTCLVLYTLVHSRRDCDVYCSFLMCTVSHGNYVYLAIWELGNGELVITLGTQS